ncbi:MAG: hypothetical protein J6W06_02960 [Bacteroidales bacterium]|nr:hypothetical protein [Bacteroidales bacterium]
MQISAISRLGGRMPEMVVYVLAFVVFIFTAVANYGYHHADELFQIIEYAGLKSGTFEPLVAWEYDVQIRPMLQPTICLAFLKFFELISVSDPFAQALVMRLFAAVLSYFAIVLFVRSTADRITNPRLRIVYLALSLLIWFIPYIGCRFSSETFGGAFFLFALSIYFSGKEDVVRKVLFGVCLALSFIFRFQMGLAIFGFGLWALLIDKRKWKYFIVPACTFLVAYALLGIGVDSWFYGEFVFAPYKYVKVNSEVSAAKFGTEPWWFYLYNLVSYPSYFVGIPLAAAIIYLLVRNPKNPYLWCLIPFFVVHSMIAHKEVRFLFPMAFLVPAIFMSVIDCIDKKWNGKKYWIISLYIILSAFALVNIVGLGVNMSKSAGYQKFYLAKYINDNLKDEQVNIIHGPDSNPYGPFGAISGFYKNENASMKKFTNIYATGLLLRSDAVNFFTCRKCDLEQMVCVGEFSGRNPFEVLESLGFEYQSQSIPKFDEKICEYYSGFDTGMVLYVFRYVGNRFGLDWADFEHARYFYSDCEEESSWEQLQTLTTENSYSGSHSSLACGENPYSITLVDSVSKCPEAKRLSLALQVYLNDENEDACIVFEALGSNVENVWKSVRITEKTRRTQAWRDIIVDFDLPENFSEYSIFKVYIYNPSETKVYCDDIFAVLY